MHIFQHQKASCIIRSKGKYTAGHTEFKQGTKQGLCESLQEGSEEQALGENLGTLWPLHEEKGCGDLAVTDLAPRFDCSAGPHMCPQQLQLEPSWQRAGWK